MKIKILATGQYKVSAVSKEDGETPVYNDLTNGLPDQYNGSRDILLQKLKLISEYGFELFSSKLAHEICKEPKLYELVQNKLRLIFFHGNREMIAVCTEIIVKKTQKVDPKVVRRATKAYHDYWQSIENHSLFEVREGKNGTYQFIRINT